MKKKKNICTNLKDNFMDCAGMPGALERPADSACSHNIVIVTGANRIISKML